MENDLANLGYAIFKARHPRNIIKEAVDTMLQLGITANWDCMNRALKTLKEGMDKENRSTPYTDALTSIVSKEVEKEFRKDMVYYAICYNGFRI